jgi:hypothetical protein
VQGYLLPGTIEDLGRAELSWIVKWPDDGFKSSQRFNHLQYAGCKLRAMNEIEPLQLHPEESLNELTVVMTSGKKIHHRLFRPGENYSMTAGFYEVAEAKPSGRLYELEIQEIEINCEVRAAIVAVNAIIAKLNRSLAIPEKKRFMGMLSSTKQQLPFLDYFQGQGRLTRVMALLNQDRLAITYKLEGRKISRTRMLLATWAWKSRNFSTLWHTLRTALLMSHTVHLVLKSVSSKPTSTMSTVKQQLAIADEDPGNVSAADDISTETIGKIIYPSGIDPNEGEVWHDYKAWSQDKILCLEAKCSVITNVESTNDSIAEVVLQSRPVKYLVTPLQAVSEVERVDEIKVGDFATLWQVYGY